MARCAQVESLAGLLSREFRAALDGYEARTSAAIKAEIAVVRELKDALVKAAVTPRDISTSFDEAQRAAVLRNAKTKGRKRA